MLTRIACTAALLSGITVVECGAELRPDEIGVIAVSRSRQSRELAEYYCEQREIPKSQICLIDVAPGKSALVVPVPCQV